LQKAQENIQRNKDQGVNSLEKHYDNMKIPNVVARLETEIFDKMLNFPRTKGNETKLDQKSLEKWNNLHKVAVLFQKILRGRAIQVNI
jgi:hypothetical protein